MTVSPGAEKYLHSKLPIDKDEKILGVYRHHWFAYASNWIVGVIVVILIMSIAFTFTALGDSTAGTESASQTQTLLLAGAVIFSALILLGTSIPVYLRSQEQLVLTEEAILQMLQPSLFASKVSQLSLQQIADVSVQQDFFGTILGYGYITIETPGEQNNYRFSMLPDPHTAAREIIAAHENFDAALQSGRIKTTLGSALPEAPQIDPQHYQEFLQYQQMLAQQKQSQQAAQTNDPTNSQPPAPQQ
jgi:uncharacterized membrane protein YdbT with pleckstrin-like domain